MKISPQATCLRRPCHSRARVRPACPRRWRSHRCRRVAFQDACGARATKTESKNLKTVSKNLWMKEWERCGGGDALAEHLVAGEDHCVRAAADCARHGAANRRPRPAQRCTLDLPRQPVQNEDLPACNGGVHFEDMKGTLLAVAPHRDRYPVLRRTVDQCTVLRHGLVRGIVFPVLLPPQNCLSNLLFTRFAGPVLTSNSNAGTTEVFAGHPTIMEHSMRWMPG